MRYGTVAPARLAGPGRATGAESPVQTPALQVPLQQGPMAHAPPPPTQAMAEQWPATQNRGEAQSALVRHTPPSSGFGVQTPYTQPNEQHCASAAQKDA